MMCMDVRRAMLKDPRTIDALFDEVRPLAGQDARFDAMVRHAEKLWCARRWRMNSWRAR